MSPTTRNELLQQVRQQLRSPAHVLGMTDAEQLAELGSMLPAVASDSGARFGKTLRRVVRTTKRRIRELKPNAAVADLHALRLRLKRLRVLAEEAAAFGGRLGSKRHHRLLTALQRLGDLSDQASLLETVPGLIAAARHPRTAAWFGAVLATELRAHKRVRRRALRAIHRLDRKRTWAMFRRVLPN
jgi:CHAD domain-containing protein